MRKAKLISIVVPLYNENAGLESFNTSLVQVLAELPYMYEVIYVNDGSTDHTAQTVSLLHESNENIKLISLSRNFGKEAALFAGISAAQGEATLTLDGDGQHPVSIIPEFIKKWQAGSQVVIGIRKSSKAESWVKRSASKIFYKLFNSMNGTQLIPGSTDFRLIDAEVREAFLQLQETERLTRGLIDWLGFQRSYIEFDAIERASGSPGYSLRKLMKLAIDSFISLSPTPLYIFGWLGIIITALSFVLGSIVFIEQIVLEDPLNWNFTGTAMLGILIIFLVGIVLLSQGILSLYVSHIHNQSKQRPLLVIDYRNSKGIKKS